MASGVQDADVQVQYVPSYAIESAREGPFKGGAYNASGTLGPKLSDGNFRLTPRCAGLR